MTDEELQIFYTRKWEMKRPGVNRSLYKGIGWGLLLMSSLLGACWAIVNWLR